MNSIMYASDMAAAALKLTMQPDGTTEKDEACAHCGKPLPKGSDFTNYKESQNFTDQNHQKNHGSSVVCPACSALSKANILRKCGMLAIHNNSAYSMTKFKTIAHYIQNPPEPPFVLVYRTSDMQHILWKAPVNLSKEIFHIQFGNKRIAINRSRVFAALDAVKKIQALMGDHQIKTNRSAPFVYLDHKLANPNHGRIRSDILEMANSDTELAGLLKPLLSLKPSDTWALSILLMEQVAPEAFDLTKLN